MDSPVKSLDRWKKLAADRRVKAFVIAALVLIAIVVLQVGQLKQNRSMIALFADCNLRSIDIHRMQIALSKSGLTEFEVHGNRLLVPQLQQPQYLQAIAEQNAIPPELRGTESDTATSNPFLSRSQQLSIERESRKQKIQEMLVRLPFVEQAWLEMDADEAPSAFQQSAKSAVISVRAVDNQPLLVQQVETVRQMIAGAVIGIESDQIVVIDLSTGLVSRDASQQSSAERKLDAQRVAFATQQLLENRLRESLKGYPGLKVSVVVEPVEDRVDQITSIAPTEIPASDTLTQRQTLSLPKLAGANGQVSIRDWPAVAQPTAEIRLTNHVESAPSTGIARERISVLIDVPQDLLARLYGSNNKPLSYTTRTTGYSTHPPADQAEQHFEELKSEIEAIVRPLIGGSSDNPIPVNFNLSRSPAVSADPWLETARSMAIENWPSLAVLLVGLILISIVSQQSRPTRFSTARKARHDESLIANDARPNSVGIDEHKQSAETRLSQLIEQDPDAAARVIESWIRDAA